MEKTNNNGNRRSFIKSTGLASAGIAFASPVITNAGNGTAGIESLALNGGPKAVTASHEDSGTWPRYGAEEEKAVLDVLKNPDYKANRAFENAWKEHFNLPYCMSYINGTSAIASMFFALNLPAGSEIMVPCATFWATITPMRFFGLVPVFIDINPITTNLDIEDAKRKLTKNTKAIFPVHIGGMPADMDRISEFANEKGLILLEDACHAHGASMHGKAMGTWGRMACFSFQATKPLPSIEGGMGNYKEREDFERAAMLGHYDFTERLAKDSKYRKYSYGFGLKLRMHPMAAALGISQLKKLDKTNAMMKAQVRALNDRITKLPGIYEQQNRPDVDRIYYAGNRLYFNEKEAGFSRDMLIKALNAEGVRAQAKGAQFLAKDPIFHETQWWHHLPVIADKFPGVEDREKRGFVIPLFTKEVPELNEQYIKAFEKIWANRNKLA